VGGRRAALFDEMSQTVRESASLSRARSGDDEERAVGGFGGSALVGVEGGEEAFPRPSPHPWPLSRPLPPHHTGRGEKIKQQILLLFSLLAWGGLEGIKKQFVLLFSLLARGGREGGFGRGGPGR
jgi:hypothetical protein